jgi:5-methylcytosine-specific restriction endonuclease McrA
MNDDRCEHGRFEMRRREHANGTVHVVEQCLDCGAQVRAVPKVKWVGQVSPARLPPWDPDLSTNYWKTKQWHWEQQRRQKDTAFWAWYNEYLRSDQWRRLRAKVFERDNYLCQGCRVNRATQAHHLTYARVGREMLFDLISVCDPCHESIHTIREESRDDGVARP